MRSRILWSCIASVGLVAAAAWLQLSTEARRSPALVEDQAAQQGAARLQPRPPTALSNPATDQPASPASAGRTAAPRDVPRVAQPEEIGFEVDATGALVKNARTRDELERILNGDPDGLELRRQEILDLLPPAAAREALDLLERFINYRQALRQALPDTSLALTEQDALVMLDTAHALRVSYFGEEITEAFFGAEEAIGRGTAQGILEAGSGAR